MVRSYFEVDDVPGDAVFTVVHPDGMMIDGAAHEVPREIVEQVAASVRPTTADELAGLRDEANARMAALPLIAEVDLPSASLQVRGPNGEPWALCLRFDTGTACPSLAEVMASPDNDGELVASLVVGDAWYVGVAARNASWDIRENEESEELEAETGYDGTWDYGLIRPRLLRGTP